MIKFLGAFVSFLLIWAALDLKHPILFTGALFFLILTTGAFSKLKYMYIFIGVATLFGTVVRDLLLGEAYIIGSRFKYISLDENPEAYWMQILLNVLFCLSLIGYGLYEAFYKKQSASSQISNKPNPEANKSIPTAVPDERADEVMRDLQRIASLLDISSVDELKEKSSQLFAELDLKYEGDNIVKASIDDSKSFFAQEIVKRTENEAV